MSKASELADKRNNMLTELQKINSSIQETQFRLIQLQRTAAERSLQIADLYALE